MARKTQGTHLYTIDPDSEELLAISCTLQLDGLGAPAAQLDATCLEDTVRQYEQGLKDAGTFTFGVNFDPQVAAHRRLKDLYDQGTVVPWAIGLSGSASAPTVDSGGTFDFPADRDFYRFNGYVSDVPQSFQGNAFVTSTISVQMSGGYEIHRATA